MGSFQKYASFHASFKRGARVADDEEQGEKASVDAGRAGRFGRGSRVGSSVTEISSNASSINYRRSPPRQDRFGAESFWCGAFCMHLPGLASRRRATMQQQQQSMSLSEPDARASSTAAEEVTALTRASVVSKAASMERFKHSSSSSGVAFDRALDGEEEEEEEVSAYFDLPLELLRSSSVDMESPVTAAFVFDSGRCGQGLLKKSVMPDQLPNLDFSFEFPAPPAFTTPSWPRS